MQCTQTSEGVSLNQMAIQFAGSTPPEVTNQIKRRSSYAGPGVAPVPEIDHDAMPSTLPPGFVRGNSLSVTPSPSQAGSLRHIASNLTTTTSLRPLHAAQLSDADDSSVNQPGLETMGPFHTGTSNHRVELETILPNSSIRTDATSLARKLATLIQSRSPQVSIDPDIESFEPRSPEVSSVDRYAARDILVRKRREGPKFKDPSAGFFKSKQSKQKAADINTWQFDGHEKSLALHEAVEESGHLGVAKQLIDMGADVNFFHQAPASRRRGLRSDRVHLIPINYVKTAAMKNNPDMVSLCHPSAFYFGTFCEVLYQPQRLPPIH